MYAHCRAARLAVAFRCLAILVPFLIAACGAENGPTAEETASTTTQDYKVFAVNRRGMAFPDNDFTVSAIFPPANFLVAQVVSLSADAAEMPKLLGESEVEIRYSAVMDANGSINTASSSKINFWSHANELYHFYSSSLILEPDQGVHGLSSDGQWMPGASNTPQRFTRYDAATATFTAAYVPITPMDDLGARNYFPLYKIEAVDRATQRLLAGTVVPLPMAEPMRCELCHITGGVAADDATSQRFGGLVWSDNPDPGNNGKENLAILHSLIAGIDLTLRQPYLCAECHYSPIADPDGVGPIGDYQLRRNPLSISIHAWHALDRSRQLPTGGTQALIPENGEASCKICHGGEQPYARGPMHEQGIFCQDCHGGLMAVGKSPLVGAAELRVPFADEPRCESCHTGDEVSHDGSALVQRKAYEDGDPFATPRIAINRRFAETPGTLYRSSLGHGGMTCISCHGSPHAEWPVSSDETHDNDIANQLQGHPGSIVECTACHAGGLALTTNGPHGLHNVNDPGWVANHGSYFTANEAACQACHGLDLGGGRLSRTAAPRSFELPDGTVVSYTEGQGVGCDDCHAMP
jgi:hypothetical protein